MRQMIKRPGSPMNSGPGGSRSREVVNTYRGGSGGNQGGNSSRNTRTPGKKKNNPLGRNRTIDYLDAKSLFRFINDQGKILPRRITGVSAYQQRQVTQAIKFARHLALLPFVANDAK